MNWSFDKPTEKQSRVEIELAETFEYVRELGEKLQKLEAVVDGLYFKAQISHSLLVIQKVSEDDLKRIILPGNPGEQL